MKDVSNKQAYRQIIKATSIFGGVQVINILVGIARSKIIALLLGPSGYGLYSLLQSTIQMIAGFTNVGISSSSVRNISEAYASENMEKITITVSVVNKLMLLLGGIGVIVTILLSRFISIFTFDSVDFEYAFIVLSITILFQQMMQAKMSVLQGMRKIKYLANSSVLGAILAFLISIPFYYFWKIDGIVPTLLLTSIITYLSVSYFYKKLKIEYVRLPLKVIWRNGKDMIAMGFAMGLNSMLGLCISYFMRAFLNINGGIVEVGLFQAGWSVVSTYVGMIFTAMGTDYYPRLATVNKNDVKCCELMNQQGEISLLIITPIIILFLLFAPLAVVILYSSDFIAITTFMQLSMLGMIFKVGSWVMGYSFVAKGESKLYIYNELIANAYMLLLNICCYLSWGIDGLGVAFSLGYLVYMLQVYFIVKRRYDFRLSRNAISIFLFSSLFVLASFAFIKYMAQPYSYVCTSIVMLFSFIYSILSLKKKIF
ncbi:oligosaccharide flippase family protein [Bacteroides timonensis]|uniref:oligosaccharide flippase family protein n=1 Tax=Bacteroides timonensis TaxID=1470345 RepID=UPI0004AF5F4C|nr:oligosaccharide flippase family protein [Bacteroides timonensis]